MKTDVGRNWYQSIHTPLVMVSIGGRKMTLAGKTVYQNG
jgi:hypothetical protein